MKKILELEALRGGAALYVFFHHALFSFQIVTKSSLIGKLFSFGQEAVMIFFLLSGYVIALSIEKKHYNFSAYFKERFLRIYIVVAMAWLVSFLVVYFTNKQININLYDFVINLLMLQDVSSLKPGVFANPLFGDSPLWSLSYEWWFYMLFFPIYYVYKHIFFTNLLMVNIIAFLVSLIGMITFKIHYNEISLIMAYFYIWFSGAFILFSINKKSFNRNIILIIFGTYVSLISIYFFLFVYHEKIISIGVHPLLELRHYIVSFLFAMFAIFFYKYLYEKVNSNKYYENVIKYMAIFAPMSFAFYVLHYPIMHYFLSFVSINHYLLLFYSFVVAISFSYIVEVKMYKYIRKKL